MTIVRAACGERTNQLGWPDGGLRRTITPGTTFRRRAEWQSGSHFCGRFAGQPARCRRYKIGGAQRAAARGCRAWRWAIAGGGGRGDGKDSRHHRAHTASAGIGSAAAGRSHCRADVHGQGRGGDEVPRDAVGGRARRKSFSGDVSFVLHKPLDRARSRPQAHRGSGPLDTVAEESAAAATGTLPQAGRAGAFPQRLREILLALPG